MSGESVATLLQQLASGREVAWTEFLAQFSTLLMRVIARHGIKGDHATDCYVHVSGALSDDGFRRLLSFRPDGPARFQTWLTAVVSNLCVDWLRHEQGRIRPLRCISRLSELDQQVYHCIYERRLSRAHCLQALLPNFPGLTDAQVSEASARVFTSLTPEQRWRVSIRTSAHQPVRAGLSDGDDPLRLEPQTGPGPDDLAAQIAERQRLLQALARMPPEQRLLLKLRYEQELTLAEIARLTNQSDPFRVNRQMQAALKALADLMCQAGSSKIGSTARKTP